MKTPKKCDRKCTFLAVLLAGPFLLGFGLGGRWAGGGGGRRRGRRLVDALVEEHVGRVGLFDGQIHELVRHLVVSSRIHFAAETLRGDVVGVEHLHLGVVEGEPPAAAVAVPVADGMQF